MIGLETVSPKLYKNFSMLYIIILVTSFYPSNNIRLELFALPEKMEIVIFNKLNYCTTLSESMKKLQLESAIVTSAWLIHKQLVQNIKFFPIMPITTPNTSPYPANKDGTFQISILSIFIP